MHERQEEIVTRFRAWQERERERKTFLLRNKKRQTDRPKKKNMIAQSLRPRLFDTM